MYMSHFMSMCVCVHTTCTKFQDLNRFADVLYLPRILGPAVQSRVRTVSTSSHGRSSCSRPCCPEVEIGATRKDGMDREAGSPSIADLSANSCSPSFSLISVMVGTTSQADLSNSMLANIPQNAREIFEQGRFGGGDLVVLDSLITRPGYKDWGDVVQNAEIFSDNITSFHCQTINRRSG